MKTKKGEIPQNLFGLITPERNLSDSNALHKNTRVRGTSSSYEQKSSPIASKFNKTEDFSSQWPSAKSKKKRRHPIQSFGIIAFCVDDENGTKRPSSLPNFLLIQRRDSYEYMDIIRGNWSDIERLKQLAQALSVEERDRILSHTFDELWDDLWVQHGQKIHVDGYERAKKKFNNLNKQILSAVRNANISKTSEPPWGFPKGKKNAADEKDQDAAIREFIEETKIDANTHTLFLCENVPPFVEIYKGNDNKLYSTYYYLAEMAKIPKIKRMETPQCIRKDTVSEEVAESAWCTYEEASMKLGPRRKNILKAVYHIINTMYEDISPIYKVDIASCEEPSEISTDD